MSKTIDSRVVDMQFNNKQFERDVSTTMTTLEKLKQRLNFDGASKGIDSINSAASGFNLSNMSEALDNVKSKFSAFEIMAITALANITNSAINTGKTLVKSLTIDQVTAGWTKYEQKTASVQTIMNATGKSIDEVNDYLDRLMWFSDETSYGFTDMTAALSQMTSSGGEVENLIPLITGVANATAYAGKGAAEFSRAMYNLNQSYGSGNLQYMDWRSLELAGVAGKELKQIFIDTGIAMGKIEEGEVTIGNFGTTLQTRWADTSVMEAAFGKFSELSEEAYKLVDAGLYDTASEAMDTLAGKYSEVAEKAFKSAQQAKTFTEAIDATKDAVSTGWMNTMEIVFGNLEEATVLWTDVTNALWDVFASGAEQRNELLQAWKDLGGRDLMIESFTNVFEALGRVIAPIKEAFRDIFPAKTGEQLYSMTESLKNFTEKLFINEEVADKLKRTFTGLFSVFDLVGKSVKFVFDIFKELFKIVAGPTADGFLGLTAKLGDMAAKFRETVAESEFFKKALETIRDIFTKVADKVRDAVERIKTAFSIFKKDEYTDSISEFSEKTEKSFKPLAKLGEILAASFEIIVKIFEWSTPYFKDFANLVSNTLGKISEKIGAASKDMNLNDLLKVFSTGALASIAISINNIFQPMSWVLDSLRGVLEAYQNSIRAKTLLTIAGAIAILVASLVVLTLLDSEKVSVGLTAITLLFVELSGAMMVLGNSLKGAKLTQVAVALVAMSAAVLILATAMKSLASLEWDQIMKGVVGVGALTAILVVAAQKLEKSSTKLIKGSLGLVAFSLAILILSKAVTNLSKLSWDEIGRGLVAFAGVMGVLVIALKNLPKNTIGNAVSLVIIAASMLIFAKALDEMGKMEWEQITKSLLALAGVLGIITLVLDRLPENMFSQAASLLIISTAILILSASLTELGQLEWDAIARGLIAMAGALGVITLMLQNMPENILAQSISLVIMGASLLILSEALKTLSTLQWDEIARGLVALGGALAILVIAMDSLSDTIAGVAAFGLMTGALALLVPSLQKLGAMSLEEIGNSLRMLVGIFAIMGVTAFVLQQLTPVILALAGAIALLGIAVLAVGAGLFLFSAGLTSLSVAGVAGAAAMVTIVTSFLSLIPLFLGKLAEGVVAFAGVIIHGIPAIMDAVEAIGLGLIKVLLDITPNVVEALLTFLITLLRQLVDAAPQMIDAGMKLIVAILKGISDHIKDVIDVAIDIIVNFLKGLADGLPGIIEAGVDVIVAFITAIGQETPRVIDAGFKMMIDFINGLADTIRENGPLLGAAMGNLAGAMIDGMIGGLTAGVRNVVSTVKDVGQKALDGLKGFLGINSPSKETMKIGEYFGDGFINAIFGYSKKSYKAGSEIAESAADGLNKSISNISDIIDADIDTQPTIRPVVDLTDVRKKASIIDAMFSRSQAMTISTNTTNSTKDSIADSKNTTTNGNTYQFTQNNYSPKALSRLEIYRQTKNQFSALKGLVEA